MKFIEPFSIAEIRRLLRLDPKTGALTWRDRQAQDFSGSDVFARRWNKQFSGRPAMTSVTEAGYYRGGIKGVLLYAHRVVWALHYGVWPQNVIDHINGDTLDNSIENLRETDHIGNGQNARLSAANTSGHTGISWCKQQEKWKVQLRDNGRKRTIGRFKDLADAVAAKQKAYKEIGFHPNHGRK